MIWDGFRSRKSIFFSYVSTDTNHTNDESEDNSLESILFLHFEKTSKNKKNSSILSGDTIRLTSEQE